MELDDLYIGDGLDLDDFGGLGGAMASHREALLKATTALGGGGTTYVTDPASLTGGGALRMQSIEPILQRSIPLEKHFAFLNSLPQTDALGPVDEYNIYDDIGGFLGGSFQGETDDIVETQGNYERKVLRVKIMATMRQVSVLAETQANFIDILANEAQGAMSVIKRDANHALFEGDDSVIPKEFTGLKKIILDTNDSDLIIDAGGEGLGSGAEEIMRLARAIADDERFGTPTNYWCSPAVQVSEFNQKVDPNVRVALDRVGPQGVTLGTPVRGIATSVGDVMASNDIFIKEGRAPWEGGSAKQQAAVTALNLTAPTIASAVAASGTAANKFFAKHAGSYYWGVESLSNKGRSATVVSGQVAVAAGQKLTLTINNPADANVTGFYIHRSKKNGVNTKSELREMIRIPRQAGATTVFVDENQAVPGTSSVYVTNQNPADTAITIRRMGPMRRFALYPTAKLMRPWAHFWFVAVRVSKPRQFGLVRNVLPASATWKPF